MKKRGRPPIKLAMDPQLKELVQRIHRETKDVRTKERAQVVLLASEGTLTYQQIADTVGRASSTIRDWIDRFCEQGADALVCRQGKGGGRPSPMKSAEVQEAIEQHLKQGSWRTAAQAREWLETEMDISRSVSCMKYWLGKLTGALKMPRPVHIKKNPAEAEDFKAHLYERLKALAIAPEHRVKVWVQDEARYGLHSEHRRCWGLKGVRITKASQQKFEWGYVYGALDVVEGGGVFCYMPTVTLEHAQAFLEQVAQSDPEAEHVVIWDGAGFHHRCGDPRIPVNVHLIALPAYSPELNPIERLWDIVKDRICNRVFGSLDAIEEKISEALRPYWEQPAYVRSLVGDGWLHDQANAMSVKYVPDSL